MAGMDKVDDEIFRLQELLHKKETQHGSWTSKPMSYLTGGISIKAVRVSELLWRVESGTATAEDREELRDMAGYCILALAKMGG